MRQLVYLDAAKDDLAHILRSITYESASLEIAVAFTQQLEGRCERLASLPGTLGTSRPELRADVRSAPHQGYVIFFRYAGDRVEVINILNGHRDITGFFNS